MNVVDSSGWLEYFTDGPNAVFFAPIIKDTNNLIVPAICLYEVFKRIYQLRGIDRAAESAGDMLKGRVVDIDTALALGAAEISIQTKLPMANSLIWATARSYKAVLWTQDEHFRTLPGVRFVPKH